MEKVLDVVTRFLSIVFILLFFGGGCDSRESNIDYGARWSKIDLRGEVSDLVVFDHSFQGVYLVFHGMIPLNDISSFIDKYRLEKMEGGGDYVEMNFNSYESISPEYRRLSDPELMYFKDMSYDFDGGDFIVVVIFLDPLNGSLWIRVGSS